MVKLSQGHKVKNVACLVPCSRELPGTTEHRDDQACRVLHARPAQWRYCEGCRLRTPLAPCREIAKGLNVIKGKTASEGHQSITPYFTVVDADRLIEFLVTAFDAVVTKESRYDDNRIQHARLRIGNSLIMLNESTRDYPANISQMHLYVGDTDSVYAAALQLGGTSLMEPNCRPHGDRMAGITDPCGNIWWIATPGSQT